MPPSAAAWTVEARQAALVHELTHIKRADRRTQAVAQLACAIYWFNPLVWHAAAGLARERERACDDEVLRFGAKPSAYATLLLDLARKPGPRGLRQRRSAWLDLRRSRADCSRFSPTPSASPRRSTRWLVGFGIITITTDDPRRAGGEARPAPQPHAHGETATVGAAADGDVARRQRQDAVGHDHPGAGARGQRSGRPRARGDGPGDHAGRRGDRSAPRRAEGSRSRRSAKRRRSVSRSAAIRGSSIRC